MPNVLVAQWGQDIGLSFPTKRIIAKVNDSGVVYDFILEMKTTDSLRKEMWIDAEFMSRDAKDFLKSLCIELYAKRVNLVKAGTEVKEFPAHNLCHEPSLDCMECDGSGLVVNEVGDSVECPFCEGSGSLAKELNSRIARDGG